MRAVSGRRILVTLSLSLVVTPLALGQQPARARVPDQPTAKRMVVDPGLPASHPALRSTTPPVAPFPLDQTFALHSKPGSAHTIYIDFDGALVSGTAWNAEANVVAKFHDGWTLDGDLTTFSEIERTAIQSIWQRVSEDYAPFDVDVTTADPGDAAIDRSGPGDAVYGTRALVSRSTQAFQSICNNQCGGGAYIDVFDEPNVHAYYQPAWIFPLGLDNDTKAIAEALSHEVGHNFGLTHDGNPTSEYEPGHNAWAPIMGSGYDRPITQFSNGDYALANNTQDDLAVIAAGGAPLRADEPTTLPTGTAYITRREETDSFDLNDCGGPITVTATPAPVSPNLDIALSLVTQQGAVLASANPVAAMVSRDVASGMGASISTTVPAGNYRVVVDGGGDPTAGSGFSDYGSVGAYTLAVEATCSPADTAPAVPTGLRVSPGASDTSLNFYWSPPATDGGSSVTSYDVFQDGALVGSTSAVDRVRTMTGLVPGRDYDFSVRAVNAVGSGPTASITATVPAIVPDRPAIGRATSGTTGGSVTAKATWKPPAFNGGAAIIGYRVTGYKLNGSGGVLRTVTSRLLGPSARSLTMSLGRGAWRFAVLAYNSVGAGPLSKKSNKVAAR